MKKQTWKISALAFVMGLVVYNLLIAQTYNTNPKLVPFQGRLQTQAGGIYPTGNYDINIRLYNAAVGGAPIWSESHSGVPAINGMFNLMLGSVSSLASISFSSPKYLAISVNGGTEMTPRQQVIPSIYAHEAGKLNGLEAGNNSGQIPVSNDIRNQGLNADLLDGYHAGNASGQIPIENGILSVNLYSERAKFADGFSTTTTNTNITGMIAMFDKACPSGWVEYTLMNGRFPKGDTGTAALTGEAAPTHVHPNGGSMGEGNSDVNYDTIINGSCWSCSTTNPPPLAKDDHTHSLTGNTASAQAQPPYQEVVFCKKL